MRCVRPALTTFPKELALRASERSNRRKAGSSSRSATSSAARCTAEGKTSLEDWPMLTWSLGCTPWPASRAITSTNMNDVDRELAVVPARRDLTGGFLDTPGGALRESQIGRAHV